MFDSLTSSADWLFILLFVICLVVFFLFWPHKVYESLFGCLVWLGMYLCIHEMTFIFPEVTRSFFMGGWIVENRGTLLWASKFTALLLFFITPMTLGLNVSWVVRGTFWFFLKTIVLSGVFICFGTVLFSLLSNGSGIFGEVTLLPKPLKDIPYFQNSLFYSWISGKYLLVLLLGFLLWIYKIIFSHWVSRIVLVGGVIYMKGNEIFGKKNLDSVIPGDMWHDEHHDDHSDHGDSHHH